MDCINLKQRFGDRYRVEYEESYYAQHGKNARVGDPWLQIIPCRNGEIYPQGGNLLAASTNRRGTVRAKLASLDCTTAIQDGDDGMTVIFQIDDFNAVETLMKSRRRRRLSEKERKRLAEMGRANLNRYRQANVEALEKGPESPLRCPPESEAA